MTTIKNYITPIGLVNLKQKLQDLFNERPKVVETVAWAAGNGDRSENGDYIYGKKRLREIDRGIRHLSKRIELSQVVDPKTLSSKIILFGATVTVEDENSKQNTYQIIGEDEIDTKSNKISWKSPLGKALLNKSIGDEVLLIKPSGEEYITILDFKFI